MTARLRIVSALALGVALGACSEPIDLDLRGKIGGPVDTSAAAQMATENRPEPDDRGIISYPNYQVAVAKRGDTLSSLATRIGLPATELARFNGMKVDDPLRKDELVALPRRVSEPSPLTGADVTGPIKPATSVDVATLAGSAIERASPTAPSVNRVVSGTEPVRHKVERGETAFTIARLYDVSPRSLAEWNGLDKDFALREGQLLLIPVAQKIPAATTKSNAVPVPGSGSPTPTPPSASKPLPAVTPPAASAGAAAGTAAVAATPKPAKPVADIGQAQATPAKSDMVMPVSGSIIRDYSKGRNEGIDISAGAGTAVKAAASGQVASISTTAEGVKFLLIRHPGDLITVYTHLDNITVQKGDAVSRGQSIGKVRSGDPSFLHFEVRKGFESTDPMGYLPG
ncbi:peptidoglycan DD-metalloendopeptidase family protein [Pelagimonas varians]|uniref:Murein hydrolase activator NlpD n=1 Tax=Pelagimonas varians TaxID=696760 RepID=A0A238KYY2_9RHOB|nr:peptidoglycan DD-metalloendopeptidase family protein [Pelagimonas varians]PYG27548.1 murein DD-endopeptidase MepM/ murein hydrolase activator NlpD [Pelagimonas varians]SMX48044.1 Murein hydrolase activator NlpD precursor [Pelagimonas varians]